MWSLQKKLETKKAYGTNWKSTSIIILKLSLAMVYALTAIGNKLKSLKKMGEINPAVTEQLNGEGFLTLRSFFAP